MLIPGTEMWISKLKWPDLKKYHNAQRSTFTDKVGKPAGYKKAYGHFQLYWVMNAGHMVRENFFLFNFLMQIFFPAPL